MHSLPLSNGAEEEKRNILMTSPLHSNQPGLQAAMEEAKNRRASHVSTYAPTPPPFDFDSP